MALDMLILFAKSRCAPHVGLPRQPGMRNLDIPADLDIRPLPSLVFHTGPLQSESRTDTGLFLLYFTSISTSLKFQWQEISLFSSPSSSSLSRAHPAYMARRSVCLPYRKKKMGSSAFAPQTSSFQLEGVSATAFSQELSIPRLATLIATNVSLILHHDVESSPTRGTASRFSVRTDKLQLAG